MHLPLMVAVAPNGARKTKTDHANLPIAPLEIAEIELTEEKEKVILPSFLAKEITGLKIYTNLSLTKHPFSKWGAKI